MRTLATAILAGTVLLCGCRTTGADQDIQPLSSEEAAVASVALHTVADSLYRKRPLVLQLTTHAADSAINKNIRRIPTESVPEGMVTATSLQIRRAMKRSWKSFYQRFPDAGGFVRISTPHVCGDSATVVVEVRSGWLSGGSEELSFTRNAGRWVLTNRRLLWVS